MRDLAFHKGSLPGPRKNHFRPGTFPRERASRILSYATALLAALALCGGHWVLLQSVAWTTMIVTYSQDSTITAAIQKTFDGAHPCNLCQTVSAGIGKQKSDTAIGHTGHHADLQYVFFNAPNTLFPPTISYFLQTSDTVGETLLPSPATPPPRRA
jgi:hypothetical protein